jgi:ribose transport system substrate-binding protein
MSKGIVCGLVLCALLCAGCGQGGPQPEPAGKKDTSRQLYIEVSALGSLPYFYDHKMGMEMVGKALGVQTEFRSEEHTSELQSLS